MVYCKYYQAKVVKQDTWFLVAVLKSHEHLAFDRTLDKALGIFEFFVPSERQKEFLQVMKNLMDAKIIEDLKLMDNRLKTEVDL